MVERHRDVAHLPDDDLAVAHDRPLRDAVDAEDRDLGMVDQRRHEEARRAARARDRERPAAQLLRRERAGLRRLGESPHVGVELLERPRVAVAHDRNDETLLGLHRDADVVAVEQTSSSPSMRAFSSGNSCSAAATAFSTSGTSCFRSTPLKSPSSTHVTGGISLRAREVLEHLPPDAADRLAPAFARRRAAAAAHVVFGDPPLRPGAGDRREIDAELLREPSDERRRAHLVAARARARCRRSACAVPSPPITTSTVPTGTTSPSARGSSRRRRRPATGSRPSSCRSRSRRADRPRRSPAPHDEPAGDLALGQTFAEVRQLELVRHARKPT